MRTSSKIIIILLFATCYLLLATKSASAIYCDPPLSGDWTITAPCVLYEDVNGTAQGDITLQTGTTLTIHNDKTLVWYPGQKITIPDGASIIINNTGQIKQAFICTKESGTATGYAEADISTDPDTGDPLYLGLKQTFSSTITDTTTDPVAWWKYDDDTGETAVDSSGNGITATLVNTPTWITGKLGYALSLASASQEYATATNTLLNNITGNDAAGNLTLSAWVYRTGAGNTYVIGKIGAVGTGGFGMLIGNQGEVYCRTDNGTTYQDSYTAISKVPASTWTHLAVVRNGTSCRVYVNATDSTSTAASHTLSGNTNAVHVGARSGAPQDYFPGWIDDVRIYNRALTASEISTMYSSNCAAGYKRREDFLSKDLVDMGTTGATGALAEVYLYLLNLGMAIYDNATQALITAKPTGTGGSVAIEGDNLEVCIGATCTLTPPACDGTNCGNLIIENKLGIGTGSPDYTLELSGATAPKLALTDTDLAHGITTYAQTDSFFAVDQVTDNDGGARVWGFSDTAGQNPLRLVGAFGSTDPTDTVPAVWVIGAKRTGTTLTTLGDAETLFAVSNNGNDKVTVLGNGNTGIGKTPGTTLDVAGVIRAYTSGATGYVSLTNGTAAAAGYVSWYRPDSTTRIAYLGWNGGGANNLGLNLENSANFNINGGSVSIGLQNPTAGFGLESATPIRVTGSSQFAQSDNTNTAYNTAPIQLREAQFGGTSGYKAPRLAFSSHPGQVDIGAQISIDASGKILILDKPGTGYANLISSIHYANSSFRVTNDSSTIMDGNQFYCNNAGNCHFNYSGTGTTNFSSSQNTIIGTGGGNLGIGVSPSYKLDVSGNANITGGLDMTQNTRLTIGSAAYLSSGGNYVNLATNEYYNGSAWVANGRAGVLFQLHSDINQARVYGHNGAGTNTTWATAAGTGGWTAGSSRQFKQNIEELTNKDYQKLRDQFFNTSLFSYNRKDKPNEPEVGFIAEEAPDYILDSSDKTQVTLMKGVGYLATVTKGQGQEIAGQQEQIESLEKIVEKLQNEINSLKNISAK